MMENHQHPAEKKTSFSRNNINVPRSPVRSPRTPNSLTPISTPTSTSTSSARWEEDRRTRRSRDDFDDFTSPEIQNVSQDIDQITDLFNSTTISDKNANNSNQQEIQETIEKFAKIIESRISRYRSSSPATAVEPMRRLGYSGMTEEDLFFIEAVMRISKLEKSIHRFSPSENSGNPATSLLLNRIGVVLQKAMNFLEEEFRAVLGKANKVDAYIRFSSFNRHESKEAKINMAKEPLSEEYYPGYSQQIIQKMNKIASAMIEAGYEEKCCRIYSRSRITAFHQELKKMDYDKFMREEMLCTVNWENIDKEIKRWINVVKSCAGIILRGEKQLVLSVFSSYPSASGIIFKDLGRNEIIRFLDFALAVSRTQRSSEKLFRILDIYEALRDLVNELVAGDSLVAEQHEEVEEEYVTTEIITVRDRIGETAANILFDLQNSIKNDASKGLPGGAVHPAVRYVVNYVKLLCEYKEIVEQILEYHQKWEQSPGTNATHTSTSNSSPVNNNNNNNNTIESDGESPHSKYSDTVPSSYPLLRKQMLKTIEILDSSIETKSWMYRDNSLRSVFMMNNGRYILQKLKLSDEVTGVLGDNWCRRRSTVVRHYHKNYQRETWVRLLNALSHEGILMNSSGKVNKPLLKERFKNFNNMFEEIHKTQSNWVVSDDQLKTELRISISAVIIPAYRSFFGRFKQYFESSKQSEKYVKYQPDDIETLIEGLFEGNPAGSSMTMGRRRFS